jgi:hypothetical protein
MLSARINNVEADTPKDLIPDDFKKMLGNIKGK